jgi:hypothetical protein
LNNFLKLSDSAKALATFRIQMPSQRLMLWNSSQPSGVRFASN